MARKEECIWFDQLKHELSEAKYYTNLAENHAGLKVEGKIISHNQISSEIEKAMSLIGKSLKSTSISNTTDLEERVAKLEIENSRLSSTVDSILSRLNILEGGTAIDNKKAPTTTTTNNPEEDEEEGDDDDDFDMFGSDDEEAEQIRKERLERYAEMKAAKPKVAAKSSIILDIKPWDDETNPADIETKVRSVSADGLKWGGAKILPVAYGIKKLQIICIVEDDKIGTDFLEESITQFDDIVQSVDIVAFNKI